MYATIPVRPDSKPFVPPSKPMPWRLVVTVNGEIRHNRPYRSQTNAMADAAAWLKYDRTAKVAVFQAY